MNLPLIVPRPRCGGEGKGEEGEIKTHAMSMTGSCLQGLPMSEDRGAAGEGGGVRVVRIDERMAA